MISSTLWEEITLTQPRDVYQATVETAQPWASGLAAVATRLGARWPRTERRQRVTAYVRGLLRPLARQNGWPLAAAAGDPTPYGGQP